MRILPPKSFCKGLARSEEKNTQGPDQRGAGNDDAGTDPVKHRPHRDLEQGKGIKDSPPEIPKGLCVES